MRKLLFISLIAVASLLVSSCCGGNKEANPGDAAIANIMNRKSVRNFTGESITQEQLETILKAAMAAPTAMNFQPWEFVVLTDHLRIEQIFGQDRQGSMFTNAGAVVVVCGKTSMMRKPFGQPDAEPQEVPNEFWFEDCSAATENLLLAVEAQGLGAVWTACYPIEPRMNMMKDALDLPEGVLPLAIVPIGHPAGEDQPKDKWNPEKIHYNRW